MPLYIIVIEIIHDASSQADTIEQYISGWIEESFRFADEVP